MAGPDLSGLVNARMLVWTREAARLPLDIAASRAGVSEQRLTEWEKGQRVPTLTQLRTLAGVYKRSMGVFFLEAPPAAGVARPVDYRRFELSAQNWMSPELAAAIRESQSKRESALSIYEEMEDQPPVFDLSLPRDTPPETAAERIVEYLGIDMANRREWQDHYAALAGWRAALEAKGVMVIQVSGVALSEMRGAALSMSPLPIILVNSTDSPLGRLFSLLHELAHIVRSESALCDEIEGADRAPVSDAIEAYCNHVAGAALVPSRELIAHPLVRSAPGEHTWDAGELNSLRRFFWASREVVLRRLLAHGRTSRAHYARMRLVFEREYAEMRAQNTDGFVPFPRRPPANGARDWCVRQQLHHRRRARTGAWDEARPSPENR
jgi:Zn-dependent peptidase ImmA (M78 family)